ncbi:MAG: cell surface protein SprA [Bacteroidetes bacterium]|nr:cell surface protein SprA [Bacteroidota bacterium]
MYAALKNTLIVGSATALFSVITFSGSKTGRLLPERSGKQAINPFTKTMPNDTPPAAPPVTNSDLHYPIKDNGYGEPVYNATNPMQLNSPGNIKTTTDYNPADSSYTFTQKMGDLNYRPPTYMTQEEYQDYRFRQMVKGYWKSRIQADSKSDPTKRRLVPMIKVNSELFDRLFGGNNVDIRPTGSAELDFGTITNRNQNPAIPVKQRKITNFNFNMKIQMNLIGNIGTKMKLMMNYNTEASFDFENQVKLQWAGDEDDILKKVEAGNVSLPLNSSLIQGSQTLFGVKATMQFGKLSVIAMAAQQRGKKTQLNIQNGAQTMTYTVQADNYEANRHYFLGQWFRDNYSTWVGNPPIVSSPIQITKIEVWVTNKTAQFTQARNIAGFSDLGEDTSHIYRQNTNSGNPSYNIQDSMSGGSKNPRNTINNLYQLLVDSTNPTQPGLVKNRQYNTAVSSLTAPQGTNGPNFNVGREFEILTRARRLDPASDYYLNNRLGYISLNTALNYDEVLMVSYQYTLGGKVYQVGEFSDQFPSANQMLVMKLLKSTQVHLQIPMWDLMMKNVYSLGAYSLSQTNFQLQVFYNNIKTGVDIPYIPYGSMDGHLLIQKMGLDRINQNQDLFPDGVYDFIPNVTVNQQNGRVYFTHVEPFGKDLLQAFTPDEQTNHWPDIQNYIFQELYDSTKVSAQQLPNKDRYKLKGSYQSATSNEFSLNAMNIPQGSVKVTAGGVALVENVDYTVDYNLGRVKIINESVLNSGQNIQITAENNSLFNVQQKSMMGARFDYKYSKNLNLGGTILHYGERPLTQKVNIGDEPVSNTMLGIDGNYTANAPWLTRLINRIPLIKTKEQSSINVAGEAADLIPGHARAISSNGGTSYIDDFEGSISTIDLRTASSWAFSSIPDQQPFLFPETGGAFANDSLRWGKNRAKLAWYNVDQSVFYQQASGITPPQVTTVVQSNHYMEAFFENDLFPKKTPPNNQPQLLPMLDLAYYPSERGPYNFDTKATPFSAGIDVAQSNTLGSIVLNKPQTRWAGIMRSLTTNDFQATNIEYIQFWMMDPFNEDYNNQSQSQYNTFHQPPPTNGELYFNLGNISEDILRDGYMSYENGIPPSGTDTSHLLQKTAWGRSPSTPPLVNAFDINTASRPVQDVGLDCYKDADEKTFFTGYTASLTGLGVTNSTAFSDPSGDNYHFYRGDDYDNMATTSTFVANTLYRYKSYNHLEGNSPTPNQYQGQNQGGYSTVGTTIPDIEDINRDNTLNQAESYYQYKIKVTPQDINVNNVGNNYIVNVVPITKQGPDGVQRTINFYQFKIPITNYDAQIGSIEGYNSIRFMRMFVKNFSAPVVMRFARLELVRNDWRNYQQDLSIPTGGLITSQQTTFITSGVSYQENGTRTPIDYVLPPGINQQQNVQTTNLVLMNEQSLSMQVDNLKDGDSRAIYKNISNDFRSYKKIRLFVHGEKLDNKPLNNGDVHLFVRIGSDFTNNYYLYEVPVQLTPPGYYDNNNDADRSKVWPSANEVIINLEEVENLKLLRNANSGGNISTGSYTVSTTSETGAPHIIGVVGNPNMGAITSVMIGVLNPLTPMNPRPTSAEVWVDELRVTDFNQHGGQAVMARVTAKLADFGQLSFSGQYATPFFGGIDVKPTDRSRNTTQQYALSGTFQLAKFLPKDWHVNLPFFFQQSVTDLVPQYDPTNGDILMNQINTKNNYFNDNEVTLIKQRAIDHTLQQGYNFTNVSKQRGKNKTKMYPWDIENFSVTYAYTRIFKRNVTTDHSESRTYNGLLSYNYQLQAKPIEPFKKSPSKLLQSPWLALIKDMSITPFPTQFNFSNSVIRTYLEMKPRDISSETSTDPLLTQTQYSKTFNLTRNYATKWNLTKNIKIDFTAVNIGRVLEMYDTGRNVTSAEKNLVTKNLLVKGGTNTNYQQTTNINITLPLNKIPALDFIQQASVKYAGNYQWLRRPFSVDSVGNTIQNTQTQGYTAQLNMVNLYNKIPYLKRLNQNLPKPKKEEKKKDDKNNKNPKGKKPPPGQPPPGTTQQPNQATKPDSAKKSDSNPLEIFDYLARVLMTVKQIQGNYNVTQGTTLPGFAPTSSILGMSNNAGSIGAPGPGFVFGGNQGTMPGFNDGINEVLTPRTGVVHDAEANNWLVHRQNFSTQYLHTKTQTLTYNANIEPIKSLKITLSGNMTHAQTESYFIGYHDSINHTYNPGYTHYSPVFGGNYSISVISIATAFSQTNTDGSYDNSNFQRYLFLRGQYSQELNSLNSNAKHTNENGYYDGYNLNQQDVVINSFVQAYTSTSDKAKTVSKNPFSRLPLPGWNVTFDGLGKLPFVKKWFKSIVLTHGYHSTLSYGNYTNNQAYAAGGGARTSDTTSSNFVSQYVINTVNISESFSPLIKVNMMLVDKGKMKGLGANFEIKRDRMMSLSSNVPQIMEMNSNEYNIGVNYTLPQLEIKKIKIRGKSLKSDLLATVTLSLRKTQSILRQAVDIYKENTDHSFTDKFAQLNQVSNGQNITTIKISLSYALTPTINLRFYYDRTINNPVISTSFPTQITNAGFSLRFVIQ